MEDTQTGETQSALSYLDAIETELKAIDACILPTGAHDAVTSIRQHLGSLRSFL
jgi:hypothetical protein